jgi:hypothetical protein
MSMETLNPTTRERRICEYPGSACSHLPCTHNPSFLCLPQAVRHRIYSEAGLYHGRAIYFSQPKEPPYPFQRRSPAFPNSNRNLVQLALHLPHDLCRGLFHSILGE